MQLLLNNEYTASLINGLNILEFWGKVGGILQQLTINTQYRKRAINAEALDRIMIKIGSRVNELRGR